MEISIILLFIVLFENHLFIRWFQQNEMAMFLTL